MAIEQKRSTPTKTYRLMWVCTLWVELTSKSNLPCTTIDSTKLSKTFCILSTIQCFRWSRRIVWSIYWNTLQRTRTKQPNSPCSQWALRWTQIFLSVFPSCIFHWCRTATSSTSSFQQYCTLFSLPSLKWDWSWWFGRAGIRRNTKQLKNWEEEWLLFILSSI